MVAQWLLDEDDCLDREKHLISHKHMVIPANEERSSSRGVLTGSFFDLDQRGRFWIPASIIVACRGACAQQREAHLRVRACEQSNSRTVHSVR